MSRLQKLSVAATATTLVLIGVGGLVRATGSGLGCPEWPRCHGRWVPPLEKTALIEYSHRFIAAIAVALVVALAVVAWRRGRRRDLIVPSSVAVALIFVQAGLGAVVVGKELDALWVTLHFATAMALLATLVVVCVNAFTARRSAGDVAPRAQVLARTCAGATAALMLAGAYVRGEGAGLAFRDWPLMNGRLIPEAGPMTTPHFVHRLLALVVAVLVGALLLRVRRERPRPAALALAITAALLVVAQALVGAANVWTLLAAPAQVAHVQLSALLWATLVALVALGRRTPALTDAVASTERQGDAASRPGAFRDSVRAYMQLTKPRIVVLLLVTTVPAMVVAADGMPSLSLIAATLLGGMVAAGGANTINCYLDRDIDEVMRRTRGRPLPARRVEPVAALRFGIVLSAASFLWLWGTVNLLSAVLALSAVLFYVFAYTIVLKRTTPQNIVIGGAAGAVPCLVGWAATTGRLGAGAAVLFAIVFFWTPPHFWALAIRHVGDYRAAGVPMLPVVRGPVDTARQILFYSILLVAVTLLLYPVARMGRLYLAAAATLGAVFVYHALRLRRDASGRAAMGLFKYSITYLALLFASMAADRLIPLA